MTKGDIIVAVNLRSKYLTNGKEYEVMKYSYCLNWYEYVWLIGDNGKKRCFALKTVINPKP